MSAPGLFLLGVACFTAGAIFVLALIAISALASLDSE